MIAFSLHICYTFSHLEFLNLYSQPPRAVWPVFFPPY